MNTGKRRISLDKKLVAYSTAAGALIAMGGAARGEIVRYDGPWTSTAPADDQPHLLMMFDLDGNVFTNTVTLPATTNNQFAIAAIGKIGPAEAGAAAVQPVETGSQLRKMFMAADDEVGAAIHGQLSPYTAAPKYIVRRLPGSERIGPNTNTPNVAAGKVRVSFVTGPDTYSYGWGQGGRGYVGLRFGDPSSDDVYYGWADLTVNSGLSVTMHAYAFETSGDPIHLPHHDVPEPSTLALLALGATGVAALRRRRKKLEA